MYPPPGPTQERSEKYHKDVLRLVKHVVKLVALANAYVLDPSSGPVFWQELDGIIEQHGIKDTLNGEAIAEPLNRIRNMAEETLRESIDDAEMRIDYADMVYIPVLKRMVEQHESGWVIVDECQNMDTSRRQMAQQLTGTGRLLVVGDENQCLYGYAGAGAAKIRDLKREMGIENEFPLTCSWRLPRSHVCTVITFMHNNGRPAFALEPAPQAEEGMIARKGDFTSYELDATKDHAILCRTNAPLMRLRLELVRKGIACHMSGRTELAKLMLKLLISTKASTLDELRVALDRIIENTSKDEWADADSVNDNDETDGSEGVAAVQRTNIDLASAMLDMMIASAGIVNLVSLKAEIAKFSNGDGEDEHSRPAAPVVRLMTDGH